MKNSLPLNSLLSPLPPLEVGPLNTARGLEELCKLPSEVRGKAPADKRFGAYSKSAALVAGVFVDFPKNKCNFLHKNKLDIVRRFHFLTGRRVMRSFSPGAVATIALWKSAPGANIASHREHRR